MVEFVQIWKMLLANRQFSRIAVVLIVLFVGLTKVEPAVQIISPVKNQIIKRNQSVLFNCTVAPASGAKFLWLLNNTGINATDKKDTPYWSSFVLTEGLHAHEGEYRCIYGDIGSDSVTVYLAAKPTVGAVGNSSPVKTEVDKRPTLSCYAEGWPTPSITWISNNQIINMNQDNKYDITVSRDGYSELAIIAIQKKDEGFYTCMARNALGEDNYTFFVDVEDAPKRPTATISAEYPQYTAVVGTDAMLVCHGEEVFDDAVTFLVWEFNGKEVNESSNHYNITNDFYTLEVGSTPKVRTQLSIFDVKYTDSGNYTCIVNSDRVVGLSDTIMLEVTKGKTMAHTVKWMIVALSVVSIILFLMLVALIFVVWWRRKRKKKLAMLAQKYDQENHDIKDVVFISYSTKDYDWVKDSLLPVFDQNGVEYVIHSRDFLPGKVWQENMADSVYNSKKVILVMSRNYLSSGSCKEEMWMALHKCTAKDDSSLILVRIDNIKSSDMPKSLRHRTFIDVTSREEVGTWQRRILEYVQSDNMSGSVTSSESLHGTDTRSLLSMFKMKRKKKKRDNINVEKELENQA